MIFKSIKKQEEMIQSLKRLQKKLFTSEKKGHECEL